MIYLVSENKRWAFEPGPQSDYYIFAASSLCPVQKTCGHHSSETLKKFLYKASPSNGNLQNSNRVLAWNTGM